MMSHIFGAAAIPLLQVNQLQQRKWERRGAEKKANLMQIHPPHPHPPPA